MRKLLIFGLLLIGLMVQGQAIPGFNAGVVAGQGGVSGGHPAILDDGNTVGWYIASSEYITTDGQDSVTTWSDASSASNDLTATDGTGEAPYFNPSGDSIYFSADNILEIVAISYSAPNSIYMVVNVTSWTNYQYILGTGSADGITTRADPVSRASNGGSNLDDNTNLTTGDWHVVKMIQNGASSIYQIDDNSEITGTLGTDPIIRIQVGQGASVISVREIIVRNAADTGSDDDDIMNYLQNKY